MASYFPNTVKTIDKIDNAIKMKNDINITEEDRRLISYYPMEIAISLIEDCPEEYAIKIAKYILIEKGQLLKKSELE